MRTYCNLERQFVERKTYNADEIVHAKINGTRVGWIQLLENTASVIIAPANVGKTTEMTQQALVLRQDGHKSSFLALRRLASVGTLLDALEGDNRKSFVEWAASREDTLTLFVDSLDEAAAHERENIDYLIEKVIKELALGRERVKWVISTRPAILTTSLLLKLSSLLGAQKATQLRSEESTNSSLKEISGEDASFTTTVDVAESARLKVFQIMDLRQDQAIRYLEANRPDLNATALVAMAKERGLSGLCVSPGGLDVLARIDLLNSPPNSLTDVFNRVASEVSQLRSGDDRLKAVGYPTPDSLEAAAEKIASASQICRLLNIEIPEERFEVNELVLSARLIAAQSLHERAIEHLLSSQLFIDDRYHQVKMYPDELAPFLAAKRLDKLVNSSEQALRLLKNFVWSAESGEQGVYREYLVMLGWLATLNHYCREELLKIDPQVLALFGDLRNEKIPLDAAETALRESIRRIAEQGDRPGRGFYNLTSENYWAAGPARLRDVIGSLYDSYADNYWARDVLIQIATASKLDVLRPKVLARHENQFESLINDGDGVLYLLTLENKSDLKNLAETLKKVTAREGIVGIVVSRLAWDYFSPWDIAELVRKLVLANEGIFGIKYVLETGDLLGKASEEQRYELSNHLITYLIDVKTKVTSTYDELGGNEEFSELASRILATVIHLGTPKTAKDVCRMCFALQSAIVSHHLSNLDLSAIAEAFKKNPQMRREFLRFLTDDARLDDAAAQRAIFGYATLFKFDDDDLVLLNNKRLKLLLAAQNKAAEEVQRSVQKMKLKEPKVVKWVVSPSIQKDLAARATQIRSGEDVNALLWVANWTQRTANHLKYGEVDFSIFVKAVKNHVAEAVRTGMSKIWRERSPRYDEEALNSTYHITVLGLQALHIEFAERKNLEGFTENEVRQALRYASFEINGYPNWYWKLVETYPKYSLDELKMVADSYVKGATSAAHTEQLFSNLDDAPTFISDALLPQAWHYIETRKSSDSYFPERMLRIFEKHPNFLEPSRFENIARKRLESVTLPADLEDNINALQEDAVLWASYWLKLYPERFVATVEEWGPRDSEFIYALLGRIAAFFGRDYGSGLYKIAKEGEAGVLALEKLYYWTKWAVPEEKDISRPSGRVYSPGPRDNAQNTRAKLIDIIASATSQASYDVLRRIGENADLHLQQHLKKLMFDLRERQYSRKPILQREYGDFEGSLQANVKDSMAFSMAVHSDLELVKYDIERGEHSLRCFFSEIDFGRVNKKGEAGAKAGLALEGHFQKLMASELNHHANGRYMVSVEPQTAERNRRDIQCSRNDWLASIEVKMSERWTVLQYLEALEEQLVGQYMRNRNANTGFLVLVLQKNRKWEWEFAGKKIKIGFKEVIKILQEAAIEIQRKNRTFFLRVIGIDAIKPKSFRDKGGNSRTN